jgi:hypothetical protein
MLVCAFFALHIAHETAGAASTRHSLRPRLTFETVALRPPRRRLAPAAVIAGGSGYHGRRHGGSGRAGPGGGFPSLGEIGNILKRGDLALAFGVLTILVVLILPLPSIVLDLFLAISITVSILILMTSLFIQAPLEFSSFPTILLISTMLRLSLNLASTRLILSHGHEGTAPPATSSRPSAIS